MNTSAAVAALWVTKLTTSTIQVTRNPCRVQANRTLGAKWHRCTILPLFSSKMDMAANVQAIAVNRHITPIFKGSRAALQVTSNLRSEERHLSVGLEPVIQINRIRNEGRVQPDGSR